MPAFIQMDDPHKFAQRVVGNGDPMTPVAAQRNDNDDDGTAGDQPCRERQMDLTAPGIVPIYVISSPLSKHCH